MRKIKIKRLLKRFREKIVQLEKSRYSRYRCSQSEFDTEIRSIRVKEERVGAYLIFISVIILRVCECNLM